MRVVAGKLKGRQLKSVKGKATRPTGDKIKEAIFHKMGPFFDGGNCLDLFAGSGSLGIEAISRGMEHVTFVEKSASAIRIIYKNVQTLHLESQCTVYRNNVFHAILKLAKQKKQFELILIDPPYEKGDYSNLLNTIVKSEILKDNGLIYLEHSPNEKNVFLPDYFEKFHDKKYSAVTSTTILKRKL